MRTPSAVSTRSCVTAPTDLAEHRPAPRLGDHLQIDLEIGSLERQQPDGQLAPHFGKRLPVHSRVKHELDQLGVDATELERGRPSS